MADSGRKRKKKKFTITATEAGIEIAERALIRLGFETKTNFAKSHYISRSTVTKFFGRKPIQLDTFKKICQELKLNWREIADLGEAQTQHPKIDSRNNLAKDGGAKQMEESGSRQVTVIETSSGTIKAEITLSGEINSVSNLKILETILRENSGNTIKIQDIKEGSIKLTIEGSSEDIEKLVALIESGNLTEIDGFPVENIQVLTEYSKEKESRYIAYLADLEDILELLYEKLGMFEMEIIYNNNTPAKFELKQRMRREILPDIRRYETEYWELYPFEAIIISEEEATTQLAKVEQAVESIEHIPHTEYPPGLVPLLQEIKAKLEDLGKPASAKLKVALPLIPAIASYELEMETEGAMFKAWKSIKKLVQR